MNRDLAAHPDELLHRARFGTALTAGERQRLATHLAGCVVCRFVEQVGHDFDAEVPLQHGAHATLALGAGAVPTDGSGDSPETAHARRGRARPARGPARRAVRAVFAGIASLILLAGVAAAARWTGIIHLGTPRQEPAAREATRPAHALASRHHAAASASPNDDLAATSAPAAAVTAALPVPAPSALPASTDPFAPAGAPLLAAPTARSVQPAAPASTRSWTLSLEDAPARDGALAPVPSPHPHEAARAGTTPWRALFEKANAERRSGRAATALEDYGRLVSRYPDTIEARAARAIRARLALDGGDPGAALRGFDEYLASRDKGLREESLVGRAEALQRLGRADAERETWRRLLADYPGSGYSARARARLEATTSPRPVP